MPAFPTSAAASAALARAVAVLRARPVAATATAAGLALVGLVVPAAVRDYRGYLALGPGGIPYNVFGWAIQGTAKLLASDPLDASVFEQPSRAALAKYGGARAQASYLTTKDGGNGNGNGNTLPPRAGSRPVVPNYTVPQRQTTDLSPDGMRQDQEAFLKALAAANPTLLEIRPSQLEGIGTAALFVRPALSAGRPQEICHAHAEGSSHMHLSLGDAAAVMRHRWGERHRLAGKPLTGLPLAYLLIYAPRDAAELRVWKQLAVAAARYGGAGRVDVVAPEF